jgi:ABC-type nitrate/sulfonate/bicarbonate transport system ATPase subunit
MVITRSLAVGAVNDGDIRSSLLSGVTLQAPQGRIVAILGGSGCGKTTLLKTLAGIQSPVAGEIVTELQTPGPKVSYQQQGESLLPWRNILDNVALGLELTGVTRPVARNRASELLEIVGLNREQLLLPQQLSGGMLQRALLARTLITKPSLLLLDEPFSQLDIAAREQLGAIVKHYIVSNDASGILVTHSVEEAVSLADYILVVSQTTRNVHSHFSLDAPLLPGSIPILRRDAFAQVYEHLRSTLQEARLCAKD